MALISSFIILNDTDISFNHCIKSTDLYSRNHPFQRLPPIEGQSQSQLPLLKFRGGDFSRLLGDIHSLRLSAFYILASGFWLVVGKVTFWLMYTDSG